MKSKNLFFHSITECKRGDVELADDGVPNIFLDGSMHPICGNYLWDNEHGATIFCKKLGFLSGTRELTFETMTVDAFYVGICRATDVDLTDCTGGWNVKRLGGVSCAAGQKIGIKFFCSGGKGSQNACYF